MIVIQLQDHTLEDQNAPMHQFLIINYDSTKLFKHMNPGREGVPIIYVV